MSLDEKEIQRVWELGYEDPLFFMNFFLPDWFKARTPWVHLGLVALICRRTRFILKYASPQDLDKLVRHFVWKENPDDPTSPTHPLFQIIYDQDGVPVNVVMTTTNNTLIMIPRGTGKTTRINACSIWLLCYEEKKFVLQVGETQTHAETQLRNIRSQFEGNDKLKLVFGDLKPAQRSGKKWTDDIIQLTNGGVLAARSRGGQIRGTNVEAERPDCIILDDVEDKESVATQQQRDKTKDWAYGDVMPALPPFDPNAYMVAVGTLLHADALLMTWLRDPEWTSIVLSIIDNDGEPLWPEKLNLDQIERKKASYARAGRLHIFYLEYMNTIRNPESALFKAALPVVNLSGDAEKKLQKAMACDPAISEDKKACMFALVCVGMETGGRIHVLDAWGKVGVSPREQVDRFFAMHKRWDPNKAGVEGIAYQAALIHLLREEMFRQRHYFEIDKIGASKQRKVDRIQGIIAPRAANGYIVTRIPFPDLDAQLLDFPNGLLDLPDALSMAIMLLDPYAAMASDHDPGEDEAEPLDWGFRGQCP